MTATEQLRNRNYTKMNSNIFNSVILSNGQVNYLMGGTAGINRLSCLFQLIQIVTRQIETSNEVGESATALWQINRDARKSVKNNLTI